MHRDLSCTCTALVREVKRESCKIIHVGTHVKEYLVGLHDC